MSSGKVRLYEYVRDQHDKLLAVRQGQKTRIGLLLVINGFFITALITFLIPSSIKVVENTRHPVPLVLIGISAIVLIHVLVYLGRSLWASLSALARIAFTVPEVNNEKIGNAVAGNDFTEQYAVASLIQPYLKAIAANFEDNRAVGMDLYRMIVCTRIATIAILVLALFVTSAQASAIFLR